MISLLTKTPDVFSTRRNTSPNTKFVFSTRRNTSQNTKFAPEGPEEPYARKIWRRRCLCRHAGPTLNSENNSVTYGVRSGWLAWKRFRCACTSQIPVLECKLQWSPQVQDPSVWFHKYVGFGIRLISNRMAKGNQNKKKGTQRVLVKERTQNGKLTPSYS